MSNTYTCETCGRLHPVGLHCNHYVKAISDRHDAEVDRLCNERDGHCDAEVAAEEKVKALTAEVERMKKENATLADRQGAGMKYEIPTAKEIHALVKDLPNEVWDAIGYQVPLDWEEFKAAIHGSTPGFVYNGFVGAGLAWLAERGEQPTLTKDPEGDWGFASTSHAACGFSHRLAAVSAAILATKKNPGPELVESFEDQLLRIAAEAAKKGETP